MVVDPTEYYTPNSKIHFVWLKVVFKPKVKVSGLDRFMKEGFQFYLTDMGSGKPTALSIEDCRMPISTRKEVQLHGLLNASNYTAEEGDMQIAYLTMVLRKEYGNKIKFTESGNEDRAPTK